MTRLYHAIARLSVIAVVLDAFYLAGYEIGRGSVVERMKAER